MVKTTKRAIRRSLNQNKKKRAQRIASSIWGDTDMQDWMNRNYNHIKSCSCWMCGHQRELLGVTIQERKSLLAIKDEDSVSEAGSSTEDR